MGKEILWQLREGGPTDKKLTAAAKILNLNPPKTVSKKTERKS
jgi:hypothetical protein